MARARERSATFCLPLDSAGQVDWNTLGNILTAHLLGEVLCVSYVDSSYGKKRQDFQADTEWEFSYEKHGVMVFKKRLKNHPLTCFMGRGIVEAPMGEVAQFIKRIESTFTWDKFVVEAQYLKVFSESPTHNDYLGYQRYETTQCFFTVKRDMLYYVRCIYIDGKYVQSAVSVEDSDFPPESDTTRVDVNPGTGFVVEPYQGNDSRTLVSYLGNVDMKGVPMFIMYQVMKRQPLCVHYIQEYFKELKERETHRKGERLQTVIAESRSMPNLTDDGSMSGSCSTHFGNRSIGYEDTVPVKAFMRAGNSRCLDRTSIRSHDRRCRRSTIAQSTLVAPSQGQLTWSGDMGWSSTST